MLRVGTNRDRSASHEGDDSREPRPSEGRYANYFSVGYNAVEVLLDFGQFYAEAGEPRMHTRIVTSPIYARALLDTLRTSLEGYERDHGPIPGENEGD